MGGHGDGTSAGGADGDGWYAADAGGGRPSTPGADHHGRDDQRGRTAAAGGGPAANADQGGYSAPEIGQGDRPSADLAAGDRKAFRLGRRGRSRERSGEDRKSPAETDGSSWPAGVIDDGDPLTAAAGEGRRSAGDADEGGQGAAGSRKRRRTPRSDWQFPLLTDWGVRPERQRLLVIIVSVVGVLAGMAGVVAVAVSIGTYSPERQASAAVVGPDATLPQVFRGWGSPKLFDPVSDRTKDGRALTEKEVFGQKELAVSKKLKLKLVAKQLDADCSAALWGEGLLEQVSDAGCTQVARGLYASSDGRYVGQYTLLNLKDGQSAAELVESLKTLYRGGWARPLTSSKGAFPPGGYSEAGGYALGHYVGLVWLGRIDGTEPGPKDDFVSLTLALRGAEKAVYRRVVTITGPSS